MARGRPSKKQIILDIAKTLFSSLGYQGTSIDLVVREAGVSKPTVYNNFPSKQALFQELIRSEHTALLHRQQLLIEQNAPLTQTLYQIYKQVIEQPFELIIFRIYYGEPHKLDKLSLDLCQTFEEQVTDFFLKSLEKLNLQEGQAQIIQAVYKDALLINTINGTILKQEVPSCEELKQLMRVLSIPELYE